MKTKFLLALWTVVFAFVYFHATDAFDQDLGRHLKLGEIIVSTREVPKTNLFSYTNANEPVFNSHWGSQVIFYGIHKAFGVSGLILLNTIINTLAFGMLFLLAVRRAGLLIPSILVIPFLFILLDRTWIRPEMFGNLFFAVILLTLFVTNIRQKVKKFFPLIAVLWINLHITAVIGVVAMGLVLLEDSISSKGSRQARTISLNSLIFVGTLFALLVNPYGFEGMLSAFTVLNKYGYSIVENQSWFFLKDFGFPLVAHIFFGFFVLLASFFARKRRPGIFELLLLLMISVLTLRFVRNEILFAFAAFLTASLNFAPFQPRKTQPIFIVIFLAMSGFFINSSHREHGLPTGLGSRESYKNGVDFFLTENLQGPIFNNFDIGGYLIYRLYPKEKVFVDNRPEAYPVAFFQKEYIPMQIDERVFREFAKKYNFQTIVWGTHDITPWSRDFLTFIVKNPDWKAVYTDDAMVIYTKVP